MVRAGLLIIALAVGAWLIALGAILFVSSAAKAADNTPPRPEIVMLMLDELAELSPDMTAEGIHVPNFDFRPIHVLVTKFRAEALYYVNSQTIVLRLGWNEDNAFDMEVLAHELTHHLQRHNGRHDRFLDNPLLFNGTERQILEIEAHILQKAWWEVYGKGRQ